MGRTPYAFGGRNLVAALRTKIASSGRIGLYQNSTYWGVLALRAADSPVPLQSLNFIRSRPAVRTAATAGRAARRPTPTTPPRR